MKAYLVTFTCRTRVVVSDDTDPSTNDDLYGKIVDEAVNRIENLGISNYLCPENSDIEEDTECPAGTFSDDTESAI